jgi:hypothetical protein
MSSNCACPFFPTFAVRSAVVVQVFERQELERRFSTRGARTRAAVRGYHLASERGAVRSTRPPYTLAR